MLLDEMSDDLGVGFGGELVAFLDQLLFQVEVVLDDPVVYYDDLASAIAVGMGVLFCGPAVGSPAGVTDAVSPVERFQPNYFFQVAQLAFGPADLQTFTIACDCNSGRIVAPILKPPQTVEDDRNNGLLADVANNAAHLEIGSFNLPGKSGTLRSPGW